MTHLCSVSVWAWGGGLCKWDGRENWSAEHRNRELPANRGFLRQIINMTITVVYHNGRVDICILEGKYKDSVEH